MTRPDKRPQQTGRLRIIGGQWRGRKLTFVAQQDLRPTPDRIRETLFNWLAPDIHGARCADLFAGSGALGLEALSRGAAHCDFVDTSSAALRQVTAHLEALGASAAGNCQLGACEAVLATRSEPYDIVFLDPPFSQNLVSPTAALLAQRQLLQPDALVYVETAAQPPAPEVPRNWRLHREKTAGGVTYRLFHVCAA